MHPGRAIPIARRDAVPRKERSLSHVAFVGSFPTADFPLDPHLPEIAILGRSNVGKSSLINCLVGRKAIARTSKTPGKTRDCNVYRIAERYYLVDLPGYGYARVSKSERRRFGRLIDRYLGDRPTLAGVVWLLDVRRDPSEDDLDAAARLAERQIPILVAITKSDKLPRGRRMARVTSIIETIEVPADQVVVTSAVSREGVDLLADSIAALAID